MRALGLSRCENRRDSGLLDEVPRVDAREAITDLLQGDGGMRAAVLAKLSDLSIADVQSIEQLWNAGSDERKAKLVDSLRELAEDNVEYNFNRLFLMALTDPVPEIRASAVEGLWEDDDPYVMDLLETVLTEDPSIEVRSAAARSLSRFAYQAAAGGLDGARESELRDRLVSVIEHTPPESRLHMHSVETLAYIPSEPRLEGYISSLYRLEDEDTQASALLAMGRSMDARWHDTIRQELSHSAAKVRFQAARAAGETELAKAVPLLARLCADSDIEVREAALWALGQIGTMEATRVLAAVIENADNEEIREAAQQALGDASYSSSLHW